MTGKNVDRRTAAWPATWFAVFFAFVLYIPASGAQSATPTISAGTSHSFALNADGTVRAWGNDAAGQLGVGRSLVSSTPLAVGGATGITAIASGDSHTIALKSNGTVLAWGENSTGQLGDGTRVNRSAPVAVTGLTDVAAIWARGSHSVALKTDGTVWLWGSNGNGELTDSNYQDHLSPVRLMGVDNVLKLSAGRRFTLALKRDGSVWAWGANDYGQLGDGSRATGRAAPAPVNGLSGIADISAGGDHSLARRGDGTVWAWGNNDIGQLGDGSTADRSAPVQVSGLSGAVQIAAGVGHSLAVKSDGSVVGWGGNDYAELGDGTYTNRPTPVPLSGLHNLIATNAISTGFLHSVAVKSDGTIAAWGNNDSGQLGDGTTNQRTLPAAVNGITGIRAVAVGDQHTAALRMDGSVWTWGDNASGQLGNGVFIFRSTPIAPGVTDASRISAGGAHTVTLRADGSVLAWGDNRAGQLGDGTTRNRSTAASASGLNSVTAVSAGGLHTLALKSDGSVVSWGDNFSAATGDRNDPDARIPARVVGLPTVTAIAAGAAHSVALASDGSVWTWGLNSSGQLGDGARTGIYVGRSTPMQVTGLSSVRTIAAGNDHTVALKNDGTVWAWGYNGDGRLGDGTLVDRLRPVQVSGLTGVREISAGNIHTLALKTDGTVWAWGGNYGYQLGDGTSADRSLPVQVSGLTGIVGISASSHSLAIKGDGTVYAWGQSNFGQLGDGTLADRSTPVVVLRENGAGSVAGNNWFLDLNPAVVKTIPAEKIPVFLAVVSATANDITASIQYRATDVGSSGSVYVFALAPANKVMNASATSLSDHKGAVARDTIKSTRARAQADTPLPCVLAQLTANGQLTAASAGTLQAFLTGVLSSQGASVSVLNGVSAAILSGAVFYIGYGSNSGSMISGGNNKSVVTIPGAQTCQPQAPQTGWWWNPAEDGRGFGIEVRGNTLFMSGYLYDESGHATWVVSPGPVALDGSLFNGTLYQVANGQTLTGTYKAPAPPTVAGPVTLTFQNARFGTLIWPGGSVPIQRFDDVIGSQNGVTPSFVPENGWWWNADESGRGFFMEFKNNFAFIAGYMYEADGRPVWYVTQNPMTTPQNFSSNWLQVAGGQTITGPYKKPTILNSNVGPVSIVFSDAANAVMTLPGGRQLAITRHKF